MFLRCAKQLHNGDEVIVKATGAVMRVVETETVSSEISTVKGYIQRANSVNVMLEDGNWYSHRDLA